MWKKLGYKEAGGCKGLLPGPDLPKFPMGEYFIHKIKVQRAPNPTDINWQDLGVSWKERMRWLMKTNGAMMVVVIVSFAITYTINIVENIVTDRREIIWSILPGLVLAFTNACVTVLAKRFGQWEFHVSSAGQMSSQAMKICFATVINTGGVILFISGQAKEWYTTLVQDVFAVFTINVLIAPIFFLTDFKYLMKGWVGSFSRRNVDKKFDEWNSIQERRRRSPQPAPGSDEAKQLATDVKKMNAELNRFLQAFEPREWANPSNPKADSWLAGSSPAMKCYTTAIRTFLVCFLYSPLCPFVCLLGCAGLTIQYWVDKYMLVRWYRRPPEPVTHEQAMESLTFIRFFGVAGFAVSCAFFFTAGFATGGEARIFEDHGLPLGISLTMLFIAAVYSIFPMQFWRVVLCIPFCLSREGFNLAKVADEGVDKNDYYVAQWLWPGPEMKYHKTQFLYKMLPESINPEFFEDDGADGAGASKRAAVDWGAAAPEAMQGAAAVIGVIADGGDGENDEGEDEVRGHNSFMIAGRGQVGRGRRKNKGKGKGKGKGKKSGDKSSDKIDIEGGKSKGEADVCIPIVPKGEGKDKDRKYPCKYGEKCTRKNPDHLEKYSHPGDEGHREQCKYGGKCYNKDSDHREKFCHPGDDDFREKCQYGEKCYNKNSDHLAKYCHPGDDDFPD